MTGKKCEDNVSNVFATSIGPMVNEEEMNRENNKVENREVTKGNSIQYQSLIIVVGIIILLYINCFIIVKRNKLYLEGEKYDELNEKGFA